MKNEMFPTAVARIDRLLDINQDLQADKARLTKRVAELEEQLAEAISNAGWERDFYRQQAEATNNDNGWK